MGEIIGELMTLLASDTFVRLSARRIRRRLSAGRPARIPCTTRADRPGWPSEYATGHLLVTPGQDVIFGSRAHGELALPAGGSFHDPEPDEWHSLDWAATCYQPPGGGEPVSLQVDSQFLPALHLVLGAPAQLRAA